MHYNREIIIDTTSKKTTKIIHLRPTLIYGVDDPHAGYGPNLFFKNFSESASIFFDISPIDLSLFDSILTPKNFADSIISRVHFNWKYK